MHDETLVPGVELLESMRSVGYSFNAAAADIIDNSIAAAATKIEVFADTVRGAYVGFLDDGSGMSPEGARDALKLAGTGQIERGESDLGRFGLGLKTASLSQGRKLTVLTKRDGELTGLQWDLDHVLESGSWSIRVLEEEDIHHAPHAESLVAAEKGTLVVWESLDYLLSGAGDVANWMSSLLSELRTHIGLVFHRFLEGPKQISIHVNGVQITAINPFLENNPRTQIAPVENVFIDGATVRVEAFTLPHISGLSAKDRKRDDLGVKMRESQGFYVYRNQRLISAGGWFGLARLDELSKQTRVRVDIPVALDKHWQLDIKKSRVEPPQAFRQRFRKIIDRVKVPSARVHRFRGRKDIANDFTYFWRFVEDRDGFRYEINPEHPALIAVRETLPPGEREGFDELIVDLADTFPAPDLYMRLAENKERTMVSRSDASIVRRLRAMRHGGAVNADPVLMAEALAKIEPFSGVANLRDLVLEVWKEDE